MANVPVEPGVYLLGVHIGFRTVLTPAPHSVDEGIPVFAQPEQVPPLRQAIIIQPATGPTSYFLSLFLKPQIKLAYANELVFAREGSPVPWTFDPSVQGLNIISDKGLAVRAEFPGAQLRLAEQEDVPQDTWSLHRLHLPIPPGA
ncbi:hypothetical protein [Streptomyces sp. NPDC003077]|uniref:hypothetical protein n=1 Tax=Streptomyces sp. NPDC003077 TaxID=3154443 RepID=UPI0033A5C52A